MSNGRISGLRKGQLLASCWLACIFGGYAGLALAKPGVSPDAETLLRESDRARGGDALLQPASRAAYQRLLAQGWIDALRARHPDVPIYTFWDYFRNHWARNAGLRIDHLLLSSELAPRLLDANVVFRCVLNTVIRRALSPVYRHRVEPLLTELLALDPPSGDILLVT